MCEMVNTIGDKDEQYMLVRNQHEEKCNNRRLFETP